MIKFNNSDIIDWNFDDSNIIKVYHNGAVVFYKFDTEQGGYKVCYAVVDDITQYTDTEFEDVYDKATEKWFKLNNLNEYEEYGIYASGKNITYYNGKLTIDNGYEYEWNGSSWVNLGEVSGSTATLPDVPFTVNYNAKQYNASTKTLLKTEGQLANVDAVITAGTPTVHDGYLTIASSTRATISGYQNYFNRSNSTPNLTIISKQRTDGNNGHMFANRDSSYNWMYRCYRNKLTLHGTSEQGSLAVTTQPVIESVRVNSNRLLTYNNYTDNTSSTTAWFNYGGTNSGKFALFAGYARTTGEWFVGDFYWVYMCQGTLTDEQVQQVINYNEEGGGEPEYPKYYDEIQDPPDNLVFSSMTEAESYECPWVGMHATIDGDKYVFSGDSQSGYEWVEVVLPYDAEIQYLQSSGTQYINTGAYLNTSNFEVGYETADAYCLWGYCHQNVGNGTWLGLECTTSQSTAFFGRYGSSYMTNISSYMTSGNNTIVYKQNGLTVNGSTISKNLTIGTDSIANTPLTFFARYDFYKGGMEWKNGSKFKSFYLKNNDEYVVDMIPVRVGQIGYMYDKISGQLFGNAGTGSFILGPDK